MSKTVSKIAAAGFLTLACLIAALPAAAQLNIQDAVNFGTTSAGLANIGFSALAVNIFYELLAIILPLAGVALVIGGVMYVVSLGDEARSARAKRVITSALIGLFIAGTPFLVLDTVCKVLNITTKACTDLRPVATWEEIADNITQTLLKLVVAFSFAAFVWGGITYITAFGDESRTSQAKRTLLGAVIGILVAGSAWAIIYATCAIIGQSIGNTTCSVGTAGNQIFDIILDAIKILLILVTPISVGAIVYGGYLYVTSTGEEGRADQAKRVLLYAVLGIAITIVAAIIVNVVVGLFI